MLPTGVSEAVGSEPGTVGAQEGQHRGGAVRGPGSDMVTVLVVCSPPWVR